MRETANQTDREASGGNPAFYVIGGFVAVSVVAAALGAGLWLSAFAGLIGAVLAFLGSNKV